MVFCVQVENNVGFGFVFFHKGLVENYNDLFGEQLVREVMTACKETR